MPVVGRIILYVAAILVSAGGLYDLFAPLPANLAAMCSGNASVRRLVRELLRALGGALSAIGISAVVLLARMGSRPDRSALILILLLIGPAELINAAGMFRVGSPFYIPLAFVSLTVVGVLLSWPIQVL